jgi:hypothetical protein
MAEFELTVSAGTTAQSNVYVQELATKIRKATPSVSVSRHKIDGSTMDLGATLAVILSSGAALAVAKGIADWLRKRQTASVIITKSGHEIVKVDAKNISDFTVERLAELFYQSE